MMAGIRCADTKPEIFLRQLLHRSGYRFRLHRKDLPGRPDIVLLKFKTAIFVNGCFWHGHKGCKHFRLPKSRIEFWEKKIGANIERDRKKLEACRELGWNVIVVWECDLPPKAKTLSPDFIGSLQKQIECKPC
jgi:DNA mismatch endonuclease (patch repair protein)